MKTLNRISQILSVVFGVGSLVLFFFPFASIMTNGVTTEPVGAQLAFGGSVAVGTKTVNLAMSGHILFVFLIMAIGILTSIFAFKSKGLRYSSAALSLISAIYMWVIFLCNDARFVDIRPLKNVTMIKHTNFVLFLSIALTLFAVFSIAYLFIDDYLTAKNNKTILRRVIQFFRDNKSEVKKIVWPGPRDVVKNTITVLVMCLVIGLLIWGIDLGLGKLLDYILK